MSQYDFIKSLIRKDIRGINARIKKAKNRIAQIKTDIAKSKKDKKLRKHLTEWKQQITFEFELVKKLNFQLAAYKQGRKSFYKLKKYADKRIGKEIYRLREKAGKTLVSSLKTIKKEIAKVLENRNAENYKPEAVSNEELAELFTEENKEEFNK